MSDILTELDELDDERDKNKALYKTCERLTDENKEFQNTIHLLEVDLAAMICARDSANIKIRDLKIALPILFREIIERIELFKTCRIFPGAFDNEAEKKGDFNER